MFAMKRKPEKRYVSFVEILERESRETRKASAVRKRANVLVRAARLVHSLL